MKGWFARIVRETPGINWFGAVIFLSILPFLFAKLAINIRPDLVVDHPWMIAAKANMIRQKADEEISRKKAAEEYIRNLLEWDAARQD